jgi:hypothetical protein
MEGSMKKHFVSRRDFIQGSSAAGLALAGNTLGADFAHRNASVPSSGNNGSGGPPVPGISGDGHMKFKVLHTSTSLPVEAQKVLVKAHGGFAVDRRPAKGETYFALPGAGILRISADLKTIRLLNTTESIRKINLHDTAIWVNPGDEAAYLVFPANDAGKIITTTLDGKLVSMLDSPSGRTRFEQPEIRDYFLGGGNFAPTGVTYLDGLYYITTGYCALDYALTARVSTQNPPHVEWGDLAFGGRGDRTSQFQTAHAVTVAPSGKQLSISDRRHSAIKQFTRYGQYLSTLNAPMGSLPCSIDYLDGYAVVPTLVGPDPGKGAPIYIFKEGQLISSIFPKGELGLKNFQHNHKAVLHKVAGKFCIIVQAWNPGDFAILEQV